MVHSSFSAGSFVALTLLNKPATGGGAVQASDQPPGGVTRRVTAPLPVDVCIIDETENRS